MAREHGVIVKRCRDCLRIALLYPAVYKAAVASLAYQLLYYLANSLEWVAAERFVEPDGWRGEALRSLESNAKLDSFDAVIVPVSYELDLPEAVALLRASGVDPLAPPGERPVIVVGGPAPSMNPAPFTRVADVVVVGEAEATLPRLLEALYEGGVDGLRCSDGFLTRLCVESGERARRIYVRDLDSAFHPIVEFRVPGSGEPWGEAYMVEVSRGCRWMCRFCLEAHFTLPWRTRSYSRVARLVEEGVEANHVSKVAFYSLSFFDHPDADKLLELLDEMGLGVSIGSLRADTLTEERLRMLAKLGQRTVTIAPETFSRRLGCLLGKWMEPGLIERLVGASVGAGLKPKLYLMTGLPGETLDETRAAAERASRLYRLSRGLLRVSLNPLIPKPWTPLQHAPFVERRVYEEAVRLYRRALGRALDALSYRWALAQTMIARGDESIGDAILGAVGAGPVSLGRLISALRRAPGAERALRGPRLDEEAPWERLVDPGYPAAALRRGFEAALACLDAGG